MRKCSLPLLLIIIFFSALFELQAQDVLRGEIMVELEPVFGFFVEDKYPLDFDDAYLRALEEAAMFFSASIYDF